MANIFGDALGSLFGQQKAIPRTDYDFAKTLSETAGQSAAANLAYNQAYAPGIFDLQLGIEKKYDPNVAALRGNTSAALAAELALGGNLSPEVQQLVTQNALQSAAGSGFGLSQGGRAITARDLGLTSMDVARNRRDEASGYVRTSPRPGELYNPITAFNPQDVLSQNLVEQELSNKRMAEEFIRKESNKVAMFNTFGRIAGGIIGGVATGGSPMGIQAGAAAGGSVFNNPYRSDNGSQSNKGLMSGGGGIFSMMSKGGGMGGGGGGGYGGQSGIASGAP